MKFHLACGKGNIIKQKMTYQEYEWLNTKNIYPNYDEHYDEQKRGKTYA
jgi:hypothetical protein